MKNLLNKNIAKLKENKGFTLVELMVVIVIIAILAAIALPAFTKVLDDAKDSTAVSEGRSLYTTAVTAHNRYYLMNNTTEALTAVNVKTEAGTPDPGMATIYGLDKDEDANAVIGVIYESDSGKFIAAVNGNTEICVDLAAAQAVLVTAIGTLGAADAPAA